MGVPLSPFVRAAFVPSTVNDKVRRVENLHYVI
jgi:hypothetical protein